MLARLLWPTFWAIIFFALPAQGQTLRVGAAAAGGFTGFKVAEVLETPAFNCTTSSACAAVADSVDLVRNLFYRWTPALSSGIVITIGGADDDDVSVGFGGHIVFAADANTTRPLPSVTVHVGSEQFQGFFGAIFAASDEVEFPNGADKFRVASGSSTSFVRQKAGHGPNFFFGIVLKGASVVKTTL